MNLHRCKRKTVCECRGVFQRLLNLCAERSQLTILEHHSICAPQPCFLRISIRIAISSRSLVWKTNHNQPYLQTTIYFHYDRWLQMVSWVKQVKYLILDLSARVLTNRSPRPVLGEQSRLPWSGQGKAPNNVAVPYVPCCQQRFHQLFYNYVIMVEIWFVLKRKYWSMWAFYCISIISNMNHTMIQTWSKPHESGTHEPSGALGWTRNFFHSRFHREQQIKVIQIQALEGRHTRRPCLRSEAHTNIHSAPRGPRVVHEFRPLSLVSCRQDWTPRSDMLCHQPHRFGHCLSQT